MRSAELFREQYQRGRLRPEPLRYCHEEFVRRIEASALQSLDILARNGDGAGKFIGAQVSLLAHQPDRPPEDGKLGCFVWVSTHRNLANWVEDNRLQPVSTYMP